MKAYKRGEGRGTKAGAILSLVCTDKEKHISKHIGAPPSIGAPMAMIG